MSHSPKLLPTRVLIIDDDPLIRTLLVSALRKDCLVAVASEGSEGFYKALDLRPDVAVIDVNMPGWDGLKTLEAFRAHPVLKDVKVIMLTADASKQTVMAAIRGGANDYLIKTSFSKADFYRKLNRLVPWTIANVQSAADAAELDPSGSRNHARRESCVNVAAMVNPSLEETTERRLDTIQDLRPSPIVETSASPTDAESTDTRLQELIDGWE